MEQYQKPAVSKQMLLKKLLWVLPFLIIGLVLMLYSFSEIMRYYNVQGRAVTLNATVCRVEEGFDADGNDEYEVFVDYTYEGKQYTKRYMVSTSDMWLDRIGDTVEIIINPDNPTEELKDMEDPLFFAMFFGLPIFGIGVTLAVKLPIRPYFGETYSLWETAFRNDLENNDKSRKSHPFLLTVAPGFIIFGILMMRIDPVGIGAIVLGIMAFILLGVLVFWVDKQKDSE